MPLFAQPDQLKARLDAQRPLPKAVVVDCVAQSFMPYWFALGINSDEP